MKDKETQHFREVIEKALEDHVITSKEYDEIIRLATMDGKFDRMERALLTELQEMLQNGMIKFRRE